MVQAGRKSGDVNEIDKAYIAGLFDGEGSVSYYQRKIKRKSEKKAYNFWIIRCEISMTDKDVIEWLHETLGFGSFHERKAHKSWLGKKTQWRWCCGYRDALQFAKLIWPHAQIKLHKLEQIIDHYDIEDEAKPSADIIYLKDKRK